MSRLSLLTSVAALVCCSCPPKHPPPPPPPSGRCEVDLAATALFSNVGMGAKVSHIDSAAQLIGGEMAHGQVGDWLLENDQIRVVIQDKKRVLGPNPYGGTIIDADLRRPAGEGGHDQMGKLGVLFQFGRTVEVDQIDVLRDGSEGGYAVIAASGNDAVNDFINLPGVIAEEIGGTFVNDPNAPLSLRATTYYVLSPGETRVRMLTAFCNGGHDNVVMAIGDLFEQGGSTDFFNPQGCTNGVGLSPSCLIDPYPWYGFQGAGVAYGVRSYKTADPKTPEPASAMIPFSGVVGTASGAENMQGLLTWLDTAATRRPGAFAVLAGSSRNYVRDLFVGKDLADIGSQLLVLDNLPRSRLTVNVKNPDGSPAVGARVAVILSSDGVQKTLMVADSDGKAKAELPPANYTLKVGLFGHALSQPIDVMLPATTDVTKDVTLGQARTLSVTIRDPFGAPLSGKVTVLCPGGACQAPRLAYRPFHEIDLLPSNVQALGFADGTGVATVLLPPGAYEVMVSRGPEYNGWPDTFPNVGQMVDLTAVDAQVNAVLAHVVDTTGWLNADLHVHAVNSADSSIANRVRVLTFAAEGVDVLVSTDHDVVTDYAPLVQELGLSAQMSSMIGCEVSPFDYGHQQAYPITRADTPNGGTFDWAGGSGPTLRIDQVYAGLREQYPGVVLQLNHPRGNLGSFTQLKVDTATGATHADPATYRMEPNPAATASDTKLMSDDFDVIEVMNGAHPSTTVMNDWMTYLSRGKVKGASGVSDTHYAHRNTGGYGRTWVKLDTFSPEGFAAAMRAHHVVAGNGPFIRLTARKVDASGMVVGLGVEPGDTLSVDAAAGEKVELTVDVQAPEWMTFDTVEVFTHASGREAVNGVSNSDWPASRVHASRMLDPTMLTVEPVPMQNGLNVRRIHEVQKFTVTPTTDTWYVVFVRGSTAAHTMFPLIIDGVGCNSSGACTTGNKYAWSFTNAVLIDTDKTGKYDDFPLKGQALSAPLPKKPKPTGKVPTADEVLDMLRRLMEHRHE